MCALSDAEAARVAAVEADRKVFLAAHDAAVRAGHSSGEAHAIGSDAVARANDRSLIGRARLYVGGLV